MRGLLILTFAVIWLTQPTYGFANDKNSAQKIEFSYEKYASERKQIIALQNEGGEESPDIGINKFDLDGDKVDEILVYLKSVEYCGAKGCAFIIYKNTGDKLKQISYLVVHDDIEISDASHNVFRNLKIVSESDDGHKIYHIWQWSGTAYICESCESNLK